MRYEPTIESLKTHLLPAWYQNAKLGIFIHWGLYSVPGWAPPSGDITQIVATQGWEAMFAGNPYAEWYLNSLKFENGPTRQYHNQAYGEGFSYDQFAPMFNEAIQKWNPAEWAALFQRAGARYVVLTTKHHDGFTLWPTNTPCPRKDSYYASRDLVGELTDAVRAHGLRMGLYYSGGLDWSFNPARVQDLADVYSTIVQEPEFVAYANGHWRELIDRYKPAVMWNDIGYPAAADLAELFAYYYNTVPEGVINERFAQSMETPKPGETFGTPRSIHYDFTTPEYSTYSSIVEHKWETCRGIGHSFGYNRGETEVDMISVEALVRLFVDVVSKNGNLLLNIGPMADGMIPPMQQSRLEGLGTWLDVNGEALYNTRPWQTAEAVTSDGVPVRYTQQGDTLYATLLDTPASGQFSIERLRAGVNTTVQLLGSASALPWRQDGDNLTITLPDALLSAPAYSLKITPLPELAS